MDGLVNVDKLMSAEGLLISLEVSGTYEAEKMGQIRGMASSTQGSLGFIIKT